MIRTLFAASLFLFAASAHGAEGLVADYTDGQRRVTVVAPTPNFSLLPNESIHPSVRPAFSAAWNGGLSIFIGGKYRFYAAPAKLLLDGKPVAEGAPVELAQGVHKLRVEYRRLSPVARVQVAWESETFAREPIPAQAYVYESAPAAAASWRLVERGRDLVDDLNCQGCHGGAPQARNARGRGPILTNVGARAGAAWMYKWLENPTAYRPDAKMPVLALAEPERRDVTAYLATLVVRGYADPGSIKDLDADATPERQAEGKALFAKIGCIACHDGTASAGMVSTAAVGSKMPFKALRAYLLRPGNVEPTGRMPAMTLNDEEATALAAFLSVRRRPDLEAAAPAGDARRGKELVASRGCLGCHTVEVDGEAAVSTLKAPPFATLNAGRGCLSPQPPPRAPRYRLGAEQRNAITAFLRTPDVAKAPAAEFRRSVEFFRCRACHDIGAPPLVEWEHRPPSLTDTGNKLRVSWIRSVLAEKVRLRPWLGVRMPEFPNAGPMADTFAAIAGAPRDEPPPPAPGTAPSATPAGATPAASTAAGGTPARATPAALPAAGATPAPGAPPAAAAAATAAPPAVTSPTAVAAAAAPDRMTIREGVRYLGRGEEGLACITCHDFNWYKSGSATPAPDMSTMHRRIRAEWFQRWMLDPARIQPGTQMPSFFTDVAKEVSHKKINDIWAALSLGKEMPLPEGVTPDNQALRLPVEKDPVVFRTFVSGGAHRSIVVGLPGGQAYAFDADRCRLQFAWGGEFLDVRPVWMERGGDKALPLGERYFAAPEATPLRIGDATGPAKPRFRGYSLEKRLPVFLYDVDGASVREKITALPDGSGLVRSFEVRGAKGRPISFLPGKGDGVQIAAQGATWDAAKERLRVVGTGGVARFSVTIRGPKPVGAQPPKAGPAASPPAR